MQPRRREIYEERVENRRVVEQKGTREKWQKHIQNDYIEI